jgi:thiamine-monophosphate kinase
MFYMKARISEEQLINLAKAAAPEYIGDDAAILPQIGGNNYVISKDLFVENVHFRTSYCTMEDIAHKALHVNLSDIAAMGARPLFALCGAAIPLKQQSQAAELLQALIVSANNSGVKLIGGDTTKSNSELMLSITIIGAAENTMLKKRSTAQVGDYICIAGELGAAHLGLTALEGKLAGFLRYKKVFLHPIAKQAEGIWLGKQKSVRSMMDISDGLYTDLGKLCKASNVSAKIETNSFHLSDDFKSSCHQLNLDPLHASLTGGEDYGLLFTVEDDVYTKLANDFKQVFGYNIKKIGKIIDTSRDGSAVQITTDGACNNLSLRPYEHFCNENIF